MHFNTWNPMLTTAIGTLGGAGARGTTSLTEPTGGKGHTVPAASTGTGHSTSTTGKPTIGQKLNPKIDADGDGKAGIMD